jgi:hypothetical protein
MHQKRLALFVITLALTLPSSARVLSYAPYTGEPAQAGIHSRSSRYFVLIEGANTIARQVVLYDTQGDEPRVLQPDPRFAYGEIYYAALFEREGDPPLILIGGERATRLSNDGGTTWMTVAVPLPSVSGSGWIDNGGADTQPIWYPVQVGGKDAPFILATDQGLSIITAQGTVRNIYTGPMSMVGRNREATSFLIKENGFISLVDLYGGKSRLFATDPSAAYGGWITPFGSTYIQSYRREGRFLYLFRNRVLRFIAGPEDVAVPVEGIATPRVDDLRFFAIPTIDFDGAWMIQRAHGKPTRLLRHTAQSGVLETMWSDPSGREVEALIPGESGQTLLIQVHVPRDVTVDQPFIDPALAVWHIGTPMPTEYDELYLNEEENKAFLHVDVDAIESGEPFVFNSGSIYHDAPVEGPVSPPVPGGADIIQEWGVVRASLRQHLVLPGVARMHGVGGTRWSTDLVISNPDDEPQSVEVRYVGIGETTVPSFLRRTQTIHLDPREIKTIPDVLYSMFLIVNGGGTLHFLPETGVNVFARTYNTQGQGTLGYGMQAIDFFNAAGSRFPLIFSGAFPGSNFRTNVLLTDTSGRGAEARLLPPTDHSPLTVTTAQVPPNGVSAKNGLRSVAISPARRVGGLRIEPTRGTIIPTVIAIDNISQDATYFPPDPPTTVPRSIPVLAHLDVNGMRIRSDLYFYNPLPVTQRVTLEAKPWDKSVRRIVSVDVPALSSRVVVDALPTLFTFTGYMRVRFQTVDTDYSVDGVRVTSRLYIQRDDGGTVGCLVPPLNNFQIAGPGDALEILGVHGGNAFRTNLGLIELSQTNTFGKANVRVRIYDQRHREIDTFTTSIDSTFGKQIDDLFASRNIDTPNAALIRVEVIDGGLVAAYVTLVDPITQDATYLPANLAAKGN